MFIDQGIQYETIIPVNENRLRIGILGGMGPQAGFELARHITSATRATTDQDHLSIIVLSFPGEIPDRSAFLLGMTSINPSLALIKQLRMLNEMDVTVAAVACNTAHAPPIFDRLTLETRKDGMQIKILNLIDETVAHIRRAHPGVRRVGVLGTVGTYKFGLYEKALAHSGLQAILPEERIRNESVFPAIYDPEFGIKNTSDPVTDEAREHVARAIVHLTELGAELIILGCTELPLALKGEIYAAEIEESTHPVLIDPALTMARALIRYALGREN